MRPLLDYLNSLPPPERDDFARRCETTIGYLRKAISVGQRIKAETCILIERESGAVVKCEHVRPDVDWATVRRGNPPVESPHASPELVAEGDGAVTHAAEQKVVVHA